MIKMAVGDIKKEANLIVEVFPVKTGESIEVGEVVVGDSGGIAATTAHTGPYFVALDVSAAAVPASIRCVVAGEVIVQAVPASAIEKGDYVELSTTTGEVTLSDKTAYTDIVGIAMEAAATTATSLRVLLGHGP